jgi:hypothetical protein
VPPILTRLQLLPLLYGDAYCDVSDWRPSLLGNRSRNSSIDTLTTPVLLRYMGPTVGGPVFPLLLAVLKKGRQYTQSVFVSRPSE